MEVATEDGRNAESISVDGSKEEVDNKIQSDGDVNKEINCKLAMG